MVEDLETIHRKFVEFGKAGHQMIDQETPYVWVFFNSELQNLSPLEEKLEKLGYTKTFASKGEGDTKTLHSYQRHILKVVKVARHSPTTLQECNLILDDVAKSFGIERGLDSWYINVSPMLRIRFPHLFK